MAKVPIRVSTREDREQERRKEINARDLTRGELFHYLFDDFFKAFYVVGCIFFDVLVVGQLYNIIPGMIPLNKITSVYFNGGLLEYYFLIIILFLEAIIIPLEIKFYIRTWKKKPKYSES